MTYKMEDYYKELPDDLADQNDGFEIELAKASPKKRDGEVSFDSEIEGQLTIDVYQTADNIVVESTIAGVKPEDIDIDISSESVTIRGKREKEERVEEGDYIYQECYWGRFARSIILPQEIDSDNSTAAFKNGILTIKLPKVSKDKKKRLKVHLS